MLNNFKAGIQQAIAVRKQWVLPDIRLALALACAFNLIYIAIAIAIAPEDEREYHFRSERGLITALSALYLASACAFCWAAIAAKVRNGSGDFILWILMGLGFAFLAIDEIAQFHERVGSIIGDEYDSGSFRNWNDVIVIAYGFIALPFVIALLPRLLQYRWLMEFFIIGFVFYVLHTVIDSVSSPRTTTSVILEESSKLFCGLFLMAGTFIGFIGELWRSGSNETN